MNFTNFGTLNERLSKLVDEARNDIISWGSLKLPIIDKTNPKYNIEFSNRLPSDSKLIYTKITLEVVFDPIVDIHFDISKEPSIRVRVGEDLVEKGFFAKDLYLSLMGEDKFTSEYFLSTFKTLDNIFFSYAISFIKYGVMVYIPNGLDEVVVNINKSIKSDVLGSVYTMLYIGEDSNVRVYESILSGSDENMFTFELSETILGKNSNLWYNIIQNVNLNSEYFSSRRVETLGSNNVEFNDILIGSRYTRTDDKIFMVGDNVESKYTGIYFTDGDQKYDILATARHKGSNQGADVIVKGVLDGRSKVYFYGTLKVEENLRGINSHLGGHSLHLSPECKSDSIPSLEVDSFDVKTGHAASLTQLDEEKLFYMMSRGLSEHEAKKAIVQGFIEGAVRRISDKDLGIKVKKLLKEKGLDVIETELELI